MGVWSGTEQDVYALIAMISGIIAVVLPVMIIINKYGEEIGKLLQYFIDIFGAELILLGLSIICAFICYVSLKRCMR